MKQELYRKALDKTTVSMGAKIKTKNLFDEIERENITGDNMINIKKSKMRKPIMIAASLAIIIALGAVFNMVTGAFNHRGGDNSFILSVKAQELTEDNSVVISAKDTCMSVCEGDDNSWGCGLNFPVEYKGNNISTVTYSINNGAFRVESTKEKNDMFIDAVEYSPMMNTPSYSPSGNTIYANQYSSYTVKGDRQSDDSNTVINVVADLSVLSNENADFIRENAGDALMGSDINAEKEIYEKFLQDVEIEATATFNDGTTKTQKLKINVSESETEKAGEKIDCLAAEFSVA